MGFEFRLIRFFLDCRDYTLTSSILRGMRQLGSEVDLGSYKLREGDSSTCPGHVLAKPSQLVATL